MKKYNKIISTLLAAAMILSALASLMTVNVFAEDVTVAGGSEATTEAPAEAGTDVEAETDAEASTEAIQKDVNYVEDYFATPEEKLATMRLAYTKDNVCLYVDSESGEVAYVNNKTGEKLFTNPYDVASSTGNEATKYEILSQIIVTFTDGTGQERIFTSYEQAADRGQIVVENIKNGIRVEYTIGREQSKILVPRLISMERFEEMIIQPLYEVFGDELYNPRSTNTDVFDVQKILSYYMIYSVDKLDLKKSERENLENTYGGLYDDLKNSDAQYARALKKFPIIDVMPVYVFDPDASEKELTRAEEIITKYCPDYTYEELEYDHILTEYKSDDANPPVFRMALEYKVDEHGLSVRLPANGIRFNESLYTLEHIQVLPYMGAGNSAYEGYNFFPDGSGTLFDFQNLNTNQTRAVSGKVYGTDFAYHEISGTYQKTIRYPVFGIVEEAVYYTYEQYNGEGEKVGDDKIIAGNIVEALKALKKGESVNFCNGQAEKLANAENYPYSDIIFGANTTEVRNVEKRGFVCIIEEGDALASLTTYHAGALSDYNTVKMQFTPRPKDSYKITDAVSVGTSSDWTVVSDRKYVGNYSMRYITLSDAEKTVDENVEVYDASWFGMAVAYRDYLTDTGIISKLTSEDITNQIPLYIETFGTVETVEKILSIPVTVMAPLTTFDNVETMYDELAAQGMKNINFKLTGYANGGMWYTVPGNLKFEKAVGGNDGFQELLDKANEVNKDDESVFGVFPDFDFAYSIWSEMFDGYSPLKHNAKTIDNRYASKRVYSATQQKYENYYDMVISPAYFAEFYEKLTKKYSKYDNVFGISVSTLGTALNSDFDEDEPYNREDSKEFTIEAFEHFEENYNEVMTDGGNAYTWKYVDHILGVSLDSSRYNFASEAVPFIGVVLHGSIKFAGDPLNMEGDLKYAMLKAIENGASPYFVLSYQNTNVLKESSILSKYYSIRYDIWSDDIIGTYSEINSVLHDVQDKYIVDHSFLSGGERVPDSDELIADILAEYNELLNAHENASVLLEKELDRAASIARENGRLAEEYAIAAFKKLVDTKESPYLKEMDSINKSAIHNSEYYNNLEEAYAEFRKVSSLKNSEDPEERAQYKLISDLYSIVKVHNVSLEDCLYKAEYETYRAFVAENPGCDEYWNYKDVVDAAYSDYASNKIANAQIDYKIVCGAAADKISNALTAFEEKQITKDELIGIINKYGAACVSVSNFDKSVMNYLNGKNDAEKLKSEISDWYDKNVSDKATEETMLAEIDKFANGESNANKVTNAIEDYFSTLLVEEEMLAKADALINAQTDEEKAAAQAVLIKAAIAPMTEADAEAIYNEYCDRADIYNKYLAAEDALSYMVSTNVALKFNEAFDIYYDFYKNEKYDPYTRLLRTPAACSDEDTAAYYAFYDAEVMTEKLNDEADEIVKTFNRKSLENYMGALVEYNWMKANPDLVTPEELSKQQAAIIQTRRSAVTNISAVGMFMSNEMAAIIGQEKFDSIIDSTGALIDDAIASTNYKEMIEIYNTALEHVELAVAAIEVLAASENYTLKYVDGMEESFLNIDVDDPDMPSVVLEAVQRAQATYYYIQEDRLDPIVDGYETKYTHNGNKVYQSISNSNIYYYGNYEAGYQYLKMVKDSNNEVSFEVYDGDISKVGEDKYGNIIYENSEDEFGKNVYFTIAGGTMTYYEKLANNVFRVKAPTVYDGEYFATRGGVEIFKDGDVYYSVNEDGTYTRYTYSRCIKTCYEDINIASAAMFDAVAAIQNNSNTGDETILNDILRRVELTERIEGRNDDEDEDEDAVSEDSKYSAKNIVCVVYGDENGNAYKTVILNYNNYSVKIEYDGVVYTIPAHYFVIHNEEGGNK